MDFMDWGAGVGGRFLAGLDGLRGLRWGFFVGSFHIRFGG